MGGIEGVVVVVGVVDMDNSFDFFCCNGSKIENNELEELRLKVLEVNFMGVVYMVYLVMFYFFWNGIGRDRYILFVSSIVGIVFLLG